MHTKYEIQHKMSWSFQHKVDYEGDTDDKNCNTNGSKSDNDNFVRNLDKEKEYEEYDECKEYYNMATKKMNLKWENLK